METVEPNILTKAISSPHAQKWEQAIKEEIISLQQRGIGRTVNHTPPGQKSIGSKWGFKLKQDSEGEVLRYNARLVALGFSQQKDTDYNKTY